MAGMTGRAIFLIFYHGLMEDFGLAEALQVLTQGLRLDIAIAGYVTLPAAILIIAGIWSSPRIAQGMWRTYQAVIATVTALAFTANIGLYKYWGFPLDNTPLLYVRTSPKDAMASLQLWQILLASGIWALAAITLYYGAEKTMKPSVLFSKGKGGTRRIMCSTLLPLLAAALIIPIRGGVGTGTNHTGSVYFSNDMRQNHAAVNPIFCFVESVTHQQNTASMYNFMEQTEADSIFATMTKTELRNDATTMRPNVLLICLEGFSRYLMEEAGHVKGVVPNLERLSREGLYFTRFYANSFRTDRALVSVLSGFPAQPTMSIMDIPKKSTSLPSLASALGKEGYRSTFYYGGDVNYSNMQSYLIGTGYKDIVCDKDFPKEELTGKWGAHDQYVYTRMLKDIKDDETETPWFRTIMTSSSHEPFDMPYEGKQESEKLNSFEYADHCLGCFIEDMKGLPCWNNTLVVIVPDHLAVIPEDINNYALWRYELPLIMTGGVIKTHEENATIGCQTDIAATVLGMLGIKHDEFAFSKDLLDDKAPHFAFFTFPDAMGMVTDSTAVIHDNTSGNTVLSEGDEAAATLQKAKAYLQKLFCDINAL